MNISAVALRMETRAARSFGGSPRYPEMRRWPRISPTISSALPFPRGRIRMATSFRISTRVPPIPKVRTFPNAGSVFPPMKTSRPAEELLFDDDSADSAPRCPFFHVRQDCLVGRTNTVRIPQPPDHAPDIALVDDIGGDDLHDNRKPYPLCDPDCLLGVVRDPMSRYRDTILFQEPVSLWLGKKFFCHPVCPRRRHFSGCLGVHPLNSVERSSLNQSPSQTRRRVVESQFGALTHLRRAMDIQIGLFDPRLPRRLPVTLDILTPPPFLYRAPSGRRSRASLRGNPGQ